MVFPARFLALAAASVALGAQPTDGLAQATSAAESACMAAVNKQYGGRESSLNVVHSEFSQANSLVIVEADGERWRCLSSNDGYVEDLSLERGSFSQGSSGSSSHGGGVTLYGDYGYRGASEEVHGDIVDMKRTRIGNDSLSSVRVPQGCRVTLYSDNNFRGRSIELYGDEPELGRTQVGNDSVSSLRVNCGGGSSSSGSSHPGGSHGRGVTLYSDNGYRGASETVYDDVVDMKRTRVGNDSLSSVQVPDGCRVTLYSDNNYRGRSIDLYGDEPELGRTRVGNDSVSSIAVACD